MRIEANDVADHELDDENDGVLQLPSRVARLTDRRVRGPW